MTTATTVAVREDARPAALLTRPFLLLAVADLAYFTADGVAIYALPLYVTGPLGSGEAGAGLAFGAFAVTALVLRPFAGRASDARGRRPLLLGGALIAAVGMALTAHADGLAAVVALRLLLGVAEAAFFVASIAALADLAPPSRMGEAISYNSLGLYLGLTIGPLLGDLLVSSLGFTAAWYGAGLLLLLAAAVVLRLGETGSPRPATEPPARLIHRDAIPASLGFLTAIVAMGGFLAFATLHAESVGLTRTSLPIALYGAVVVTCRLVFAKVPDRLPALPLGAAALAAVASGLLLMAAWASPAGALGGAVLLALGITFSTPAFFSAVFATATPSERGAAAGTASAALDVGLGAGPILLGIAAGAAGIPWAFTVAAGVALAGCAWTLLLPAVR
ncbi:MAG TPA: MFS transporter [Nonomuraea sp.]|nr:MFS transporter [Nonomuraea sp.]